MQGITVISCVLGTVLDAVGRIEIEVMVFASKEFEV